MAEKEEGIWGIDNSLDFHSKCHLKVTEVVRDCICTNSYPSECSEKLYWFHCSYCMYSEAQLWDCQWNIVISLYFMNDSFKVCASAHSNEIIPLRLYCRWLIMFLPCSARISNLSLSSGYCLCKLCIFSSHAHGFLWSSTFSFHNPKNASLNNSWMWMRMQMWQMCDIFWWTGNMSTALCSCLSPSGPATAPRTGATAALIRIKHLQKMNKWMWVS